MPDLIIQFGDQQVRIPIPAVAAAPDPPANLTATPVSSTRIDVACDASPGATSYLFQKSADGIAWADVGSPPGPAAQATDLAPATLYTFRALAVNAVGMSDYSAKISAPTPAAPAVPATPAGLTATPVSPSRIDVAWAASPGATSYTIQRSLDGIAWADVATQAGTTAQVTGLAPATTCRFRVRAANAAGPSAYSASVSAATPAIPTAPGTPTGLTATAAVGRINLAWTAAGVATGYAIQQSTDGTTWSTIATPAGPTPSYAVTAGLAPATTYHYRVAASNDAGTSAYSVPAAATTPAPAKPGALPVVTIRVPATTPIPAGARFGCGHPFRRGDVPKGSRPSATIGGARVPLQVDRTRTWPDGSLAFGVLKVVLPAIPASAAIGLQLAAEPGAPDATIPGGRSAVQVRDELVARFPAAVAVADLRKGIDTLTLTAPGKGYPPYDASGAKGINQKIRLDFVGGVPVQPEVYGEAWTNEDGTLYDGAFVVRPKLPYATPPKVVASTTTFADGTPIPKAYQGGSGGAYGFRPAARDGSGAWTWKAADPLAMLGATDARGRVRCEVIEVGPLCVTFACWGPIVDVAGGAAHPHLVVRAWYRCWLDGTTGAIDRVEYLHSLDQGGIEDLAGGAVPADLQVGDVAVALAGKPVPGRSWVGVRVVHHTANPLTAIDGTATSASPDSGGSDWTSGAPDLRVAFDRHYWRATGLVPAYDLEYYDARPLRTTPPTGNGFAPGARGDGQAGAVWLSQRALNAAGTSPILGLIPHWDIAAFLTDDPGYIRDGVTTALNAGTIPVMVRNPETGRIPVLLAPASYPASGPAAMGANRPGTWLYNTMLPQRSGDFALTDPTAPFKGGGDWSDPDNWDGAWGGTSSFDMSHWPSFAYLAYLRTGAPWLLEPIKAHANHAMMVSGPGYRDGDLPGGIAADGRWTCWYQPREEAWSWKMVAQCLAVLPDAAPERPYLRKAYDLNVAGSAAVIDHYAAISPGFANCGFWSFRSTVTDFSDGITRLSTAPWMINYIVQARAFAAGALGLDADTAKWLAHMAKFVAGLCGGGTPARPCGPFGAGSYVTRFGWGKGDAPYYADWTRVPTGQDNACLLTFDDKARTTGWISSYEPGDGHPRLAFTPGGGRLLPGDRIFLAAEVGGAFYPDSLADIPPELAHGGTYYLAAIDATKPQDVRVRLSRTADLKNPIAKYGGKAGTSISVGFEYFIDRLPVPTPGVNDGSHFIQGEGIDAYAAIAWMAARLLCTVGAIDPAAPWLTAMDQRMTTMASDWTADPTYRASKMI